MKCPKCGSKNVQGTNWGKRVLSAIGGFMAASGVALFTKNSGKASLTGRNVYKTICKERTYICLNPNCKHIFSKPA